MDTNYELTDEMSDELQKVAQYDDGTMTLNGDNDLGAIVSLIDSGLLECVEPKDDDNALPTVVRATDAGHEAIMRRWPHTPIGGCPRPFGAELPPAEIYLHPVPADRTYDTAPRPRRLQALLDTVLDRVEDGFDDASFWLDVNVQRTAARTKYRLAMWRGRSAAKKINGWWTVNVTARAAHLRIWASAARDLAAVHPLIWPDDALRDLDGFTLPEVRRHAAAIADALADAAETPIDKPRPPARPDIERAAGDLLDQARCIPMRELDPDNPNSLVNRLRDALWPICGRGVQAVSLLHDPFMSASKIV